MNNSYKIFPFLWAISILFQLCSCYYFPLNLLQTPPTAIGIVELFLLLVSLLIIFRPHSIYLLISAAILIIIDSTLALPALPNHRSLTAFISIAIIISSLKHRKNLSLETVLKDIAGIIRFFVFTLYFYAVFHKLNSDFLFSNKSCAQILYNDINSLLKVLPENSITLSLVPWITILTEGILPIILFFSKTRNFAILVAIVFHFFLSIDPATNYTDFSSTMYPLLVFFLSDDFLIKSKVNLNSFLRSLLTNKSIIYLVTFCFLIIFCTLFISNNNEYFARYYYSLNFFWYFYVLALITYFSFSINGKWQTNQIKDFKLIPPSLPLKILALIFFLNGSLPYFGIKTRTAYDMYSNLRVEGGISNHLLIKKTLDLLGHTNKLVKIIDSSDSFLLTEYKDKNLLLTYFEFWRYTSSHLGISVSYEINGQSYNLKSIIDDPNLATPPNFFLQKLLWYRPVDAELPARCQW